MFYFARRLIKHFLVKTVFSNNYLKISLSPFLKCLLILTKSQLHVSYSNVSYKQKLCIIVAHVSSSRESGNEMDQLFLKTLVIF